MIPGVVERLETAFDLKISGTPEIHLVKAHEDFRKISPHPLTVAFASPSRNLIVIDQSKMRATSFTLMSTLEHEVCHILLHQHIESKRLPRWLDEGLCQWVSGSIDEMLGSLKASALRGAVISGSADSIDRLSRRFPEDTEGRRIAYEASRRFTVYLVDQYGRGRLTRLLQHMAEGEDVRQAFFNTYGLSFHHVEGEWRASLGSGFTWLMAIGHHLYEILFASAAFLAIFGFARMRRLKREYVDEEDEEV